MAYTALYRNFRPIKFSEMVGQDHITRTLKNQIILNRVGHAYLFNGGRGTGKTTSAKILARAVNCLNPQEGEPCNECEICKEILDGSLTDVVEMDAASNNGVDYIRTLREEVNFFPTKAKYRVYIIDEVHMLSQGAFNALLKTLEEPPEHVKFILATTEPQKIPATILSRCQRFDYKKIPNADIISRLKIICNETKINANDEALKVIAVLSEGHMRDAISILERCSQESVDEITADIVKELVGIPSLIYVDKLSRAIIEQDTVKAIQALDEVIKEGKDLSNYLWEVIKYLKDILLYKTTNNLDVYSQEEIVEIKSLADITDEEKILNIIYVLSDLQNQLRASTHQAIMFQVYVIKACRGDVGGTESTSNSGGTALLRRLELIEEQLEKMKYGQASTLGMRENAGEIDTRKTERRETDAVEKKKESAARPVGKNDIWRKILINLKNQGNMRIATALLNSKINEVNDLVWEVVFPNGMNAYEKVQIENENNRQLLKQEVFKVTGKEIMLRFVDGKQKSSAGGTEKKDPEVKDFGIDINIIE